MTIEQDRAFIRTFALILAALTLFTVVVFFAGRAIQATQPESEASKLAALQRTAPVGEVNTDAAAAADLNAEAVAASPEAAAATGAEPAAAEPGKAVYDRVCFACHANAVAGAPKFGDADAWAPRIAKGMDTLYSNSINGFSGELGIMPPKGGLPDLSDDEVKAAVDFMVKTAGGASTQAAPATDTAPAGEAAAPQGEAAATPAGASAAPADLARGKEVYDAACFVCHASGVAGAPKLGDAAAWQKRVDQGMETLFQHSIQGFAGSAGIMPPKGGRTDFSDDDVKAAVSWMVGQIN